LASQSTTTKVFLTGVRGHLKATVTTCFGLVNRSPTGRSTLTSWLCYVTVRLTSRARTCLMLYGKQKTKLYLTRRIRSNVISWSDSVSPQNPAMKSLDNDTSTHTHTDTYHKTLCCRNC